MKDMHLSCEQVHTAALKHPSQPEDEMPAVTAGEPSTLRLSTTLYLNVKSTGVYLHPQVSSLPEIALLLLQQTPAMPGGCMLIVGNQGSIKQLQDSICMSTNNTCMVHTLTVTCANNSVNLWACSGYGSGSVAGSAAILAGHSENVEGVTHAYCGRQHQRHQGAYLAGLAHIVLLCLQICPSLPDVLVQPTCQQTECKECQNAGLQETVLLTRTHICQGLTA